MTLTLTHTRTLTLPGADGLFVMNRCIDVVFLVDMAMQFFVMHRVVSDAGGHAEENDPTDSSGGSAGGALSGGRWEYRIPRIAMHYLRGWFSIDVLSIIPSLFDILPLVPGSGFEEGETSSLKVRGRASLS